MPFARCWKCHQEKTCTAFLSRFIREGVIRLPKHSKFRGVMWILAALWLLVGMLVVVAGWVGIIDADVTDVPLSVSGIVTCMACLFFVIFCFKRGRRCLARPAEKDSDPLR